MKVVKIEIIENFNNFDLLKTYENNKVSLEYRNCVKSSVIDRFNYFVTNNDFILLTEDYAVCKVM